MSFCSLIQGITPTICRLCFVLINNVLSNLLCLTLVNDEPSSVSHHYSGTISLTLSDIASSTASFKPALKTHLVSSLLGMSCLYACACVRGCMHCVSALYSFTLHYSQLITLVFLSILIYIILLLLDPVVYLFAKVLACVIPFSFLCTGF